MSGVLTAPTLASSHGPVAAADASPSALEERFVSLVNAARSARGLRPLKEDSDLRRIAAAWTDHLVADGRLSHNPALAEQSRMPWRKLGENVGRGGDVEAIEVAFESSPSHLRNIIDLDFDSIGVVVRRSGERIYVTQQFRDTAPATDDEAPAASAAPSPRR